MRGVCATGVASVLLAGGVAWGGSGLVEPAEPIFLAGDESGIQVVLDFGSAGVGSYGSTLNWDPAVLTLVEVTGGDPPFDAPVVNTADAAEGRLHFADAVPGGAGGRVVVLRARFAPLTGPPATAQFGLDFGSAFGGEDFADALPDLAVRGASACVPDHRWRLRARVAGGTVFDWDPVPGAVRYDLVRGHLEDLSAGAGIVPLITECVENDSTDTTTGDGVEPGHPDTEVPLPDRGFFYVARFEGGTYGFGARCALERVVVAGDCAAGR